MAAHVEGKAEVDLGPTCQPHLLSPFLLFWYSYWFPSWDNEVVVAVDEHNQDSQVLSGGRTLPPETTRAMEEEHYRAPLTLRVTAPYPSGRSTRGHG